MDEVVWLEERDAVRHRPDMYTGPKEPTEIGLVFALADQNAGSQVKALRDGEPLSPIFTKLLDEVLVNASDECVRKKNAKQIYVDFDREQGKITVTNKGTGISVKPFNETGMLIPSVIFGEFRTSTNFKDTGQRTTGGRNGVGVKVVAVLSKIMEITTVDEEGRKFEQTFSDGLKEKGQATVKKTRERPYTRVSFVPDYEWLGMRLPPWEKDSQPAVTTGKIVTARTIETAARLKGRATTFLDSAPITPICDFRTLGEAVWGEHIGSQIHSDLNIPGSSCYVFLRGDGDVDSLGFVNSARCSVGSHMRVADKIYAIIAEAATNRRGNSLTVRPSSVKELLGIIVDATVGDPAFTSQAKDALATPIRRLGYSTEVSEDLAKKIKKCSAVEEVLRREASREVATLGRSITKTQKRAGVLVEKYDPAILAGKGSCTLILTEGDSAKALATAGLSVIGRERFGIFPLRGVPLNLRNVSRKKVLENKEVLNVLRILGCDPASPSVASMRYDRIALFTDQDPDGSHIAALVINMFDVLFPNFLAKTPGFLARITTPLLKLTKGDEVLHFHSAQEFAAWESAGHSTSSFAMKYYKGLGTSTHREAKDLFRNLDSHVTALQHSGDACNESIEAFFCDKRVDTRKSLLGTSYDATTFVDWKLKAIPIYTFLYTDVVHFSRYHLSRAIPSVLDGLKPSQRKCVFFLLGEPKSNEIKVAQAAAATAFKTKYHHGEESLVEATVALAQDHVGTNNVALCDPLGQFGTRNEPPKIHAAARYIFTRASVAARALFPSRDYPVLTSNVDEGTATEPTAYVPVLPVVLLNGANGIGTGWSTSIPTFNPLDIANACECIARNEAWGAELAPFYEGFTGLVQKTDKGWKTIGRFSRLANDTLLIEELPIGKWTETFLKEVKEMSVERRKLSWPLVSNVWNESSENTVRVTIILAEKCLHTKTDDDIINHFGLCTNKNTSNMYLFDSEGSLRQYSSAEEILIAHSIARRELYCKRKKYEIGECTRQALLAREKSKFITEIIAGTLCIRGLPIAEVSSILAEKGFAPYKSGYSHLLSLPFASSTTERAAALEEEALRFENDLALLRSTNEDEMWIADIAAVRRALEEQRVERNERYAMEETARTEIKRRAKKRKSA